MRFTPARAWLLVLLSAVLQVVSFPLGGPLHRLQEVVAWFSLAPFLIALLWASRQGRLLPTQLGYGCGILFYLGNCYWIYQTMHLYGGLPPVVALLILLLFSAYLGLYHALFAFLFGFIAKRTGSGAALLAAPFLWVGVELARGRITGFPWDLLGYSQIDNFALLALAPAAGVMAVSFVVAAANSCWAAAWLLPQPARRPLYLSLGALSCAALLAVGFSWQPRPDATQASAVLLQENLSVGATARDSQPVSLRDELQQFSAMTLQASQRPAAGSRPSLAIWPEAPSHLFSNDPQFQMWMGALAQRLDTPLVIGSIGVDRNPTSLRGYSAFDSAALFTRDGVFRGRYDKIHLVPWGEYVPYKQVFRFAEKLTEGVGDMDPGSARTLFHADGHRFGVFICYESIFGDEVREFAQEGAEVLVNISDDGWYGDSGAPWQHLNMARMRAVENRRWLLRDTNTGETTAIDPHGRYTTTARHVRTAYTLPFAFASQQTVYTRYGDWFAWGCAGLALCALLSSLLRPNALN